MEDQTVQPLAVLRQYGLIIGLFITGLVVFVYGLMQYFHPPSEEEVTFHTQTDSQKTTVSPTTTAEIVVDIEGAITTPGVYHLPSTARLQELITKAGGFNVQVDREKVAKGLNLAEKLSDGAKVYIPFLGEETTASVGLQTVLGASSETTGLINVNTASLDQLDSLPGVGSVTAGKIVSNRPFSSTEELVSKKAVGQATYEKLKDMVTVK